MAHFPLRASPLVVTHTVADRQLIVAASDEAAAQGIRAGMTLTEARALCSQVRHVDHDPARDARALEALGRWMMRFSPVVALCSTGILPVSRKSSRGQDARATGLFLDITGCELVFGGLENIVRQAIHALARMGVTARLAVAPTPGAAWALAGEENGIIIHDEREIADALAPLPPIALRIDDDTAAALHHLGLRTIGDVMQLPREVLPARFGHALGERIDQALGRIPEPLVPLKHVEEIQAKMEFDGSVDSLEAIWAVFRELLGRVITQLERRGHGVRRLDVHLLQPYAPPIVKSIALSRPSRDPVNIFNLFRCAVESLEFGVQSLGENKGKGRGRSSAPFLNSKLQPPNSPFDGFSGLRLIVPLHERMTDEQIRLLDGETYAGQLELDRLIERLCARLGDAAVVKPELVESYLPERAWAEDDKETRRQGDKVTRKGKRASPSPCHPLTLSPCHPPPLTLSLCHPHRPLHLLPMPVEVRVIAEPCDDSEGRPMQFSHKGRVHRLASVVGPERIAGEWWRGHRKTRDYYDVADPTGRRFWIFRVSGQGSITRPGTRWFLHGMFA